MSNDEVKGKLEWMVGILPEPFKSEFTEDVLIDDYDYDMKTLEKTFSYYIEDCWEELPQSVKNVVTENYVIIEV